MLARCTRVECCHPTPWTVNHVWSQSRIVGDERNVDAETRPRSTSTAKCFAARSVGNLLARRRPASHHETFHGFFWDSAGVWRTLAKAGDGVRTRDLRLGRPSLYQLSYTRAPGTIPAEGQAGLTGQT
jgi:hypothetical protein